MVEGKSPRCWFWHSGPIRTSVVRCIIRIHSFSFRLVISLGSVEIRLKPRNSSSRVHVGDEVGLKLLCFHVYSGSLHLLWLKHPKNIVILPSWVDNPYAARSVKDRAPNWANSSKITSRRDGVLMCPLEDCHFFFILVGTLGTFFGWMHSAPKGASFHFSIFKERFFEPWFFVPSPKLPEA